MAKVASAVGSAFAQGASSDAPEAEAFTPKRKKILYHLTDLGPGDGFVSLNNKGDVLVSGFGTGSTPFIYRDGKRIDLPTGCIQAAYSINDERHVAGSGSSRAVTYAGQTNTCNDLGRSGRALDINNNDEATGVSDSIGNGAYRAFIYSGGVTKDIVPANDGASYGSAINDKGHVTGWAEFPNAGRRAFNYRNGALQNLGTLGGYSSEGYDINDRGDVVGYSYLPGPCLGCGQSAHAFFFDVGSMRDIDTLASWFSIAYSINNEGVAVGFFTNNDEYTDFQAFIYKDGVMRDLNEHLDKSAIGWRLLIARSINDSGEIVGTAWVNNAFRTFLLTPVGSEGKVR